MTAKGHLFYLQLNENKRPILQQSILCKMVVLLAFLE